MTLEIEKAYDLEGMSVDRDGTGNGWGRQGLYIWIGGIRIHFDDEIDAQQLARMILWRLGDEKPVISDPRIR